MHDNRRRTGRPRVRFEPSASWLLSNTYYQEAYWTERFLAVARYRGRGRIFRSLAIHCIQQIRAARSMRLVLEARISAAT
jgi:hypothetical protein